MRWHLALAILVMLAAGCQTGGAPAPGTYSAMPSLPANATFSGQVVPPPATGSFAPPPSAYAVNAYGSPGLNGAAPGANSLFPNGFNVNGWLPNGWSTSGTNMNGVPAAAPNAVTSNNGQANNGQAPFDQRYQPLSLNTTGTPPATTGFTANSSLPPASYGQASPPNAANAPGFSTPFTPTGFQANSSNGASMNGNPPNSFNAVNTGGFNSATPPPTYAGTNPILSWANRLHNYVFNGAAPSPGQWQTWSGADVTNPAGASNGASPPGFTANTSFNSATNTNAGSAPANWQTRPEQRSLRTTNDNYAPEPPVKIPDAALAGAVNAARQLPNYPPPSYPARPNVATQPTNSAPLPPRSNAGPVGTGVRYDPAWPELTNFPPR